MMQINEYENILDYWVRQMAILNIWSIIVCRYSYGCVSQSIPENYRVVR